ncbi:serine/threonine-protein kinase WNK2-like [Schistocerca nitens]|uniref:serine/threonine-protein kinase WNK2-like n=1 Tax=Schistocerca nitens TaxID=7011 RepID=UPI00211996E3|nr:serine/threonine-protein kinase WNK2-like [Schistocerca nitens]
MPPCQTSAANAAELHCDIRCSNKRGDHHLELPSSLTLNVNMSLKPPANLHLKPTSNQRVTQCVPDTVHQEQHCASATTDYDGDQWSSTADLCAQPVTSSAPELLLLQVVQLWDHQLLHLNQKTAHLLQCFLGVTPPVCYSWDATAFASRSALPAQLSAPLTASPPSQHPPASCAALSDLSYSSSFHSSGINSSGIHSSGIHSSGAFCLSTPGSPIASPPPTAAPPDAAPKPNLASRDAALMPCPAPPPPVPPALPPPHGVVPLPDVVSLPDVTPLSEMAPPPYAAPLVLVLTVSIITVLVAAVPLPPVPVAPALQLTQTTSSCIQPAPDLPVPSAPSTPWSSLLLFAAAIVHPSSASATPSLSPTDALSVVCLWWSPAWHYPFLITALSCPSSQPSLVALHPSLHLLCVAHGSFTTRLCHTLSCHLQQPL